MADLEIMADGIRRKIARRDALSAEVRALDRQIMEEGRAYWNVQGCKAFPRVEALRQAVGA